MEYKNPAVTVDILILRMNENKLQVLTIKRTQEPYQNQYSLIGGFVKYGETIEESLQRILCKKSNIILKNDNQVIILPIVSDDTKRDVRGWIFTVPVIVMMNNFEITNKNLIWRDVSLNSDGKLQFDYKLAYDHNKILELSLNYIRNQLLLHNYLILKALLPQKFTSRMLYNTVYEFVGVKKPLSNFMRESNLKKLLINTGEREILKSKGPSGQPSLLYSFIK